jgi:predicted RNase H-like nuclease
VKEEGCVLFGGEGTRMGWFCLSGEDGVGKPLVVACSSFQSFFFFN